jgi:hypothetical protein
MNTLRKQMEQIAYDSLCKHDPRIVSAIKAELKSGRTVKQIEKSLGGKKFQTSLIAQSAILAAYHIKNNPHLLDEIKTA